ncbi:unnamed protein product [Amoebophrya sp. A25]|nr:unnamed protein product [Amoebophrya sp. A25]|eukprot:GSA25T00006943001.1
MSLFTLKVDETAFPSSTDRDYIIRFAAHMLFHEAAIHGDTLEWDTLLEFIIHWSDGLIERGDFAKFFSSSTMCSEKPSAIDGAFRKAYTFNIPRYGGLTLVLLEGGFEESVAGGQIVRFLDPITGNRKGMLEVPVPRAPILVQKEDDPGPIREVLSVQYIPGSNVFLTSSNTKFITAWDLDNGRPLKKIVIQDTQKDGPDRNTAPMTFSHLFLAEAEESLFLADMEGGRLYRWYLSKVRWRSYNEDEWRFTVKDNPAIVPLPNGHQKPVLTIVFLESKRVLATGALDGSIILWDLISNCRKRELSGHAMGVTSLAWSGKYLISAGFDSRLIVWDPHAGSRLALLSESNCSILDICLLGNNNILAAFDEDCNVKLYDLAMYNQVQLFIADGVGKAAGVQKGNSDSLGNIKCMCKIHENRIAFGGSRVLFWDSTAEDSTVTSENPITCFLYCPYPWNEMIVPVKSDLVAWDVYSGCITRTIRKVTQGYVSTVSRAEKRLIVGSERGELQVYLLGSRGLKLKTLTPHQTEIVAIESLAEVQRIITLCAFKVIQIHDDSVDKRSQLLKKIEVPTCSFIRLASTGPALIAAPIAEGYVVFWNVAPVKLEGGEPNEKQLEDDPDRAHNSTVAAAFFFEKTQPLLLTIDTEGVLVFWGRKPLPPYAVYWKSSLEKFFSHDEQEPRISGSHIATTNSSCGASSHGGEEIRTSAQASKQPPGAGGGAAGAAGAVPPATENKDAIVPASGAKKKEDDDAEGEEGKEPEEEAPMPSAWKDVGIVTAAALDTGTETALFVATDSGSLSRWSLLDVFRHVERFRKNREAAKKVAKPGLFAGSPQKKTVAPIRDPELRQEWFMSRPIGGPIELIQYGNPNLLFVSGPQQIVYLFDAVSGEMLGKLQKDLQHWDYLRSLNTSEEEKPSNMLGITQLSSASTVAPTTSSSLTQHIVPNASLEGLCKTETDKINAALKAESKTPYAVPETTKEISTKARALADPELMTAAEKRETALEGSWRVELRQKKFFPKKVPSMLSPERMQRSQELLEQRRLRRSGMSQYEISEMYGGTSTTSFMGGASTLVSPDGKFGSTMGGASTFGAPPGVQPLTYSPQGAAAHDLSAYPPNDWKPPLLSGLKRGKRFDDNVSASAEKLAAAFDKIGDARMADTFRRTKY